MLPRISRIRGFGAYVEGVDLRQHLGVSAAGAILQAVHEHGFALIQSEVLTEDEQVRLTHRLGRPLIEVSGTASVSITYEGTRGVFFPYWHCDLFGTTPVFLSVQHTICGGAETSFLDGYAAFERMPTDLKTEVAQARAVYSGETNRRIERPRNMRAWEAGPFPLAWKHPRINRRSLYINRNFIQGFVGYTEEQTNELLERIDEHLGTLSTTDAYCDVPSIAGNTIVVDNRAVLHRGPQNPERLPERRLRRTCTCLDAAGDDESS